jgi:hypothetical protein
MHICAKWCWVALKPIKDVQEKEKRKEVNPNVGDFPIGAHGDSLQTWHII